MTPLSDQMIDFATQHQPFAGELSREVLGALVLGPRRVDDWGDRLVNLETAGARTLRDDAARLSDAAKSWSDIVEAIHARALMPVPGKADNRKKSFEVTHEEAVARQTFLASIGAGLSLEDAVRSSRASVMLDGLLDVWTTLRDEFPDLEQFDVNAEARCRLAVLGSAGLAPGEIESAMREHLATPAVPARTM